MGRGVGTLALVALLVFSAHVAGLIRQRGHGHESTSRVALSAGVTAAGLGLVSCTAQFAAVARANDIDLQVAGALLDLSGLAFVTMWLPIAVFMLAVATAGWRFSLVPRWFTVTTAVLAVALLVGLATMPLGNAGFVAVMLGFLWFVAASMVLVRRAGDGQPEPRVDLTADARGGGRGRDPRRTLGRALRHGGDQRVRYALAGACRHADFEGEALPLPSFPGRQPVAGRGDEQSSAVGTA